jgi:Ca-activated chloride channel homolog
MGMDILEWYKDKPSWTATPVRTCVVFTNPAVPKNTRCACLFFGDAALSAWAGKRAAFFELFLMCDILLGMRNLRRKVRGFLALLPFVLLAALPGLGQDQEQSQTVIHVDVNLVMVDATVKNKAGQIMADLMKDDFELREDGAPQRIEVFSKDQLPLNVALVLDLSDSIGPFLEPLREAAQTTLASLKPEDQVALFTFATNAELRVPFTHEKNKIAEAINEMKVGGATNINDGIFVAAQEFLNSPLKGRRVIILISDDVGTIAGGQGTNDIVTETTAADVALYNLKIPGYNPPGTLFMASMVPGLVNIRKVMDATGGELFDVRDVAHLDKVFRALIERLKTRYTLGFYTNATAAAGKPHKLEVRLASSFGKKGHDYTILARNGYYIH